MDGQRKITALSVACEEGMAAVGFAACDDGTFWRYNSFWSSREKKLMQTWTALAPVPQEKTDG